MPSVIHINKQGRVIYSGNDVPLYGFARKPVPDGFDPAKVYRWLPADPAEPLGNGVVQEIPVPQTVPPQVTPRQIRLALVDAGLDPDAITAALDLIEDDVTRKKARIEWEYASVINRRHPLIAQLAAIEKMPEEQVDALFQAAAAFQ